MLNVKKALKSKDNKKAKAFTLFNFQVESEFVLLGLITCNADVLTYITYERCSMLIMGSLCL